jgi:CheY-like chemotaxis protein
MMTAPSFVDPPVDTDSTTRSDAGASKLRVLFVDDDEFMRDIVGEHLGPIMNLMSVESVAQAIGAIATFDPQVVLTDLDLGPGPDGTDLIEFLAANHPNIARVILSAHDSQSLSEIRGSVVPANTLYLSKLKIPSMIYVEMAIASCLDEHSAGVS